VTKNAKNISGKVAKAQRIPKKSTSRTGDNKGKALGGAPFSLFSAVQLNVFEQI
jgi:hypothetical protein